MYKRKSTFLVTVTLLVLLRIAIGWQFLYEGLWQLQSRPTAQRRGRLSPKAGPGSGLRGGGYPSTWANRPFMSATANSR